MPPTVFLGFTRQRRCIRFESRRLLCHFSEAIVCPKQSFGRFGHGVRLCASSASRARSPASSAQSPGAPGSLRKCWSQWFSHAACPSSQPASSRRALRKELKRTQSQWSQHFLQPKSQRTNGSISLVPAGGDGLHLTALRSSRLVQQFCERSNSAFERTANGGPRLRFLTSAVPPLSAAQLYVSRHNSSHG